MLTISISGIIRLLRQAKESIMTRPQREIRMQIIGLSGKRGTGKTSLAEYYSKHHGYEVVSFAKPLRQLAKTLFPLTDKDLGDPKLKEKPFRHYSWSPREFLINLGEFMRYHEPSYWLDMGLAQCKDKTGRYVFDDVRYVNEAEGLKALGAKIIRVNRFEKNNPYGKNLDTPSETSLDAYSFDFVVHDCVNVKLSDLYGQGDLFLKETKWQ